MKTKPHPLSIQDVKISYLNERNRTKHCYKCLCSLTDKGNVPIHDYRLVTQRCNLQDTKITTVQHRRERREEKNHIERQKIIQKRYVYKTLPSLPFMVFPNLINQLKNFKNSWNRKTSLQNSFIYEFQECVEVFTRLFSLSKGSFQFRNWLGRKAPMY